MEYGGQAKRSSEEARSSPRIDSTSEEEEMHHTPPSSLIEKRKIYDIKIRRNTLAIITYIGYN